MNKSNGHKPQRIEVARRLAWAAGTLDPGLPATLRRRIEDLKHDGYNEQYCAVLERAAFVIEATDHYRSESEQGKAEQAYIDVVADNRRLRNALLQIGGRLHAIPMDKGLKVALLGAVGQTIRAFKEPGEGRVLLATEIGAQDTRVSVLDKVTAAIEQYFAAKEADSGEAKDGTNAGGNPAE